MVTTPPGMVCSKTNELHFVVLEIILHLTITQSAYILRVTIGPPAKRHFNGVSLVGRLWPGLHANWGWVSSGLIFCFLNPKIDGVLMALIGVILYAGLTYLPGHMVMMFHFLLGTHET